MQIPTVVKSTGKEHDTWWLLGRQKPAGTRILGRERRPGSRWWCFVLFWANIIKQRAGHSSGFTGCCLQNAHAYSALNWKERPELAEMPRFHICRITVPPSAWNAITRLFPWMTYFDFSLNSTAFASTAISSSLPSLQHSGNSQFTLTPKLCRRLCNLAAFLWLSGENSAIIHLSVNILSKVSLTIYLSLV